MNIIFISSDYPNPFEPTKATFNHGLVQVLARGHEVRVVSPIAWTVEWRAEGGGHERLGRDRRAIHGAVEVHYPRYYYPPKLLRDQYGWFFWRSVRVTVRQLIRSRRPDAVIGFWAHPDGEAAVRVARSVGAPSAVIVGGSDVLLLTRRRGRRRRVLDVLQATDAVVTVSRHLRETIVDLGVRPERVHVWYRGVDEDLFAPGNRPEARRRVGIPVAARTLVWVGRMVPVKGLDVLIDACTILRRRGAHFRLYLVGHGPHRCSLEAEVLARGLSDTVSFVGARPHDELPDWYRAADLTVLPSRLEGLPNVLRESLACGTPFVASGVGGIPEIAEEGSSLLVPPDDPTALAEAIALALAEWGPSSRPRSPSKSWAESAEALLCIIRPLTSATPSMGIPHAFAAQS